MLCLRSCPPRGRSREYGLFLLALPSRRRERYGL
nr:MAG TPA: hypothetical protein [Caudoviricetes sp.]